MAGEKVYIADKETLDKVYNILAVDPIYGFIEHMNILSPTQRIEYIGLNKNFTPVSRNTNGSISLNDWAGFEILEANKPYMVRSDGTPDYRLQDNDYSKKYSDGSASGRGQHLLRRRRIQLAPEDLQERDRRRR